MLDKVVVDCRLAPETLYTYSEGNKVYFIQRFNVKWLNWLLNGLLCTVQYMVSENSMRALEKKNKLLERGEMLVYLISDIRRGKKDPKIAFRA